MARPRNIFLPLWRRIKQSRTPMLHATLDLTGSGGIARLFRMPPRFSLFPQPAMLDINGEYMVPLDAFQDTLVRNFLEILNRVCKPGKELAPDEVDNIVNEVVRVTRKLYPEVPAKVCHREFQKIMRVVFAFALNQALPTDLHFGMDMKEWARRARAPRRVDLMVYPIEVDGRRSCPEDCLICYAKSPAMSFVGSELLTTEEWLKVIKKLGRISIPELTFTGGEATVRLDLVQLISAAREFCTRLNTSGVLMTPKLAAQLKEAELDSVQITLYSNKPYIHNLCVGRDGAFDRTVRGIRNAVAAALNVSVNIPLLRHNSRTFTDTIRYVVDNGVRVITCSGLIETGGARDELNRGNGLTPKELLDVLRKGIAVARSLGISLQFTSPGKLQMAALKQLGLDVPECGASLSNMAVMPNGRVVHCQSWLKSKRGLGHILKTPWWMIWNHPACVAVRREKALRNACPL